MFLLYLKYERYITMKKLYLLILINLFLFSCAPVLTRDLMQRGIYTTRLSEIKQNPVVNKGKLFILGGIVVNTTVKKEGSLVEAIFVPVDSMGYLKGYRAANERFLAIYRSKKFRPPHLPGKRR
jgi:outer membrane lipoprotein